MFRLATCVGTMLALGCGTAAAQVPQAGNPTSASAAIVARTSRTVPITIRYDRNSLQGGLEIISSQIGVPIEIVTDDLRAAGFTNCQSFGVDLVAQPVEDVLKTLLAKVNPDGRLIYTVRRNAEGQETVYIAVREDAEKRGEKIFPEFAIK